MSEAIAIEGLVKRYGDVVAVAGIDLTVPEGSVFAFLGANGAGKTTTVEVLEGIRRATAGTVRVLGLDPWTDGYRLHRSIGVIPQEFRFFDKITPAEAIHYYAELFHRRVDPGALLARVALADKDDARFENLSGGQKQKLGLALALVNDPRVCFLDEPTTGLDPHARRGIWEVIRQLRSEGRTVFLTTHYLEEAEILADHVAIIHHGRVIAQGAPADIVRERGRTDRLAIEGDPRVASLLAERTGLSVRSENGAIEVALRRPEDAVRVVEVLANSGLPWRRFAMVPDTLEDVFIAMVGEMDEGVLRTEARA